MKRLEATLAELESIWVPKRAPKWSPRGSQDGAKNEKKNEVNLGRVSVCLGRVRVSPRVFLQGRWGSKGRQVRPKTPNRYPRGTQEAAK